MNKWPDNITDSIRRSIELESSLTPEQLQRAGKEMDEYIEARYSDTDAARRFWASKN